jgi:hypothetical protein
VYIVYRNGPYNISDTSYTYIFNVGKGIETWNGTDPCEYKTCEVQQISHKGSFCSCLGDELMTSYDDLNDEDAFVLISFFDIMKIIII